jgi:hypothetical protein
MRLVVHLADMGGKRNTYRFLMGKSEGRDLLEHRSLQGRIILEWIFNKHMGGHDPDLFRSGQGR